MDTKVECGDNMIDKGDVAKMLINELSANRDIVDRDIMDIYMVRKLILIGTYNKRSYNKNGMMSMSYYFKAVKEMLGTSRHIAFLGSEICSCCSVFVKDVNNICEFGSHLASLEHIMTLKKEKPKTFRYLHKICVRCVAEVLDDII
jgi:hypothetical protein